MIKAVVFDVGETPWGYILEAHPDMKDAADWRMTSLADLPDLVARSALA